MQTLGTVVFVHGLWMNGADLFLLGVRLRKMGYKTIFFHYPTVRASVVTNAEALWRFLEGHFGSAMSQADDANPVHLVCHSLGGVVGLHLLSRHPEAKIRRMVALGTPFRGCTAARRLSRFFVGSLLLGGSMSQGLAWGGPQSVPEGREIGILAGVLPFGVSRFVWGLEEPNDGTITVAETQLAGASHMTLPHVHMGLVFSTKAANLVHKFLSSGSFN